MITLPRLRALPLPLTAGHAWWFVFGLALVLRLLHLNTPGLWYDESGSTWMASLPLPQLLAATAAAYWLIGYPFEFRIFLEAYTPVFMLALPTIEMAVRG